MRAPASLLPLTLTLSLALSLTCGLAACGVEPSAGFEPEPICDGSDQLRLGWVAVQGQEGPGAGVNQELGRGYLYVRGDCSYWTQPFARPPELAMLEARTGTLTEDQADALTSMVRYQLWGELEQSYPAEGSDEGIIYLFDTMRTLACSGQCPSAPEDVRSIFLDPEDLAAQLWTDGAAMDGPVKARAQLGEPGASDPVVAWDLAEITPPELSDAEGRSVLVDDPATAAALRGFRAAHPELDMAWTAFFVEFEGENYLFGMRDVLPIEGEFGITRPPQF